MPLKLKPFRHRAAAIPVFAIAGLVTVRLSHQGAQPQQPDVAHSQAVVGRRRC